MSRDLIFIGPLMFLYLLIADSIRSGDQTHVDSPKACELMHCGREEHCVSRKFWCKNPPCPSMVYCSKTPRESLKGPMTCASVRCSKGYICLVRVRRCRWDQRCKQQIARCVSEREYRDGPASCVDFHCPSGHRCILKESSCPHPPCKLLKSCARTEDVQVWHDRCRTLGCPSEYECFLRRPSDNCSSTNLCKHTPDCTIGNAEEVSINSNCQGWVCPRHHECSALVSISCSSDDSVESCQVNRTCHGPLDTFDTTSYSSTRFFPRIPTIGTKIRDDILPSKDSEPTLITTESHHQESNYYSDPTKQTTASIGHLEQGSDSSQTGDSNCSPNESTRGMQLEKWNQRNGKIYRVPVYVRSTVNRNSTEAGESQGGGRPTDNSITEWLDHLRLKTGVNAINVWIKQAEENRKHEQFDKWLAAVRATLGPIRFEIWLREIRKLTSDYPAFQKWLATDEAVLQRQEHDIASGNDRKPKLGVNSKRKTAESPVHDHGTLTEFYHVDQEAPNTPLRKNAGHPRINYGQNRGYKQHRDSSPPKLKHNLPPWYMILDPSGRPQTDQDKANLDPSQDYPANHSLQLDHETDENVPSLDYPTVELSNRQNSGISDDSTLASSISPTVQLQESMWNDSRLQDRAQAHNSQDPLSSVVANKEEKYEADDLMKENGSAQVPLGFGELEPGTSDKIRNRSGLDALFNKIGDPKWPSDPQTSLVSIDPRQFTEKDQRETLQASESPESMQRQYYQRPYELDHKVPEAVVGSRNSSPDIGTKKEKDLTKTYTSFTPAPDEPHIISPWNSAQVLDPEERIYYTLIGFSPEQANDRIEIIGYPLVVSRVSSNDRANIFPQNAKDRLDISQNSKSSADQKRITTPNAGNQISQQRPLLHQPVPLITQNLDYPSLEERKQRIDLKSHQAWPQSRHREQNNQRSSFDVHEPRPVSAPFQDWYLWDRRTPYHLPEASYVSTLPTNLHNTGSTEVEENFKEYVDAYLDAVIEDALSKIVISEKLQDEEIPGPLSGGVRAATNERLEEVHIVDTVLGAQIPGKNALTNILIDENPDGEPYISTVQLIRDALTDGNEITTTATPNSSIDSIGTETDYQYECEDGEGDPPRTMEVEEKSSAIEDEEGKEYHSEDEEQQEYFDGVLRYQDEYFGGLGTNSTDYDFQSYDDEEYDELMPKEANVEAKLSQL